MNYEKDWKLKPRNWKVIYADSRCGLTKGEELTLLALGGALRGNSGNWGLNIRANLGSDTITVDSGGDKLVKRRVCLVCQKAPVNPADSIIWVAWEELTTATRYEPEWRLHAKKWKVIYAAATGSNLEPDDELQFPDSPNEVTVIPGTGSKSSSPWGSTCTPVPDKDAVTLIPTLGGISSAEIRRRVCLIGPPGASGGATWVAEEGG